MVAREMDSDIMKLDPRISVGPPTRNEERAAQSVGAASLAMVPAVLPTSVLHSKRVKYKS